VGYVLVPADFYIEPYFSYLFGGTYYDEDAHSLTINHPNNRAAST